MKQWEGHDAEYWRRVWNAGDVLLFESTASTNDVLAQRAAQHAPHFTIAIAEEQTTGRGRGGSSWTAPAGSSLLFSVLLHVNAEGPAPGCAPVRIGLAVAEAVEGARVKWPNDVVIPGHGKIAGILCEGVFGDYLVAGIGINVRQTAEDFGPELAGQAASIASIGGDPDRAVLLTRILSTIHSFDGRITELLNENELERFAALDILHGNEIICETSRGECIVGVARGVAHDGALLMTEGAVTRRIYNASVRLAHGRGYPGSAERT